MKNNLKKVVTLALLMSLMSINNNILSILPRIILRAVSNSSKTVVKKKVGDFGEKVSLTAVDAVTNALTANSSLIKNPVLEAATQALSESSAKIATKVGTAASSSAKEAVSQKMRPVLGTMVTGFGAMFVSISAQFKGLEQRLAERFAHSADESAKKSEETNRLLEAELSRRASSNQGNPMIPILGSSNRYTLPDISMKNSALGILLVGAAAGLTTFAYRSFSAKSSARKSSFDPKQNLNNVPQSTQAIVLPTEITRSAVSTAKKSKKKLKKKPKKTAKKSRKSNNQKKKKYAIKKAKKNPRGRIVRSGN